MSTLLEQFAESRDCRVHVHSDRVRILSRRVAVENRGRGVVYWMSRDSRVQDNWALICAQKFALKLKLPLHVCFCLTPKFLNASLRQFHFLLEGLKAVK